MRTCTHPGEMLLEEFLKPAEISLDYFARAIGVPLAWLNDLIAGEIDINSEMAEKIGAALGTSAALWTNLQEQYDASLASEHGLREHLDFAISTYTAAIDEARESLDLVTELDELRRIQPSDAERKALAQVYADIERMIELENDAASEAVNDVRELALECLSRFVRP